jgi:hypothetical protein
MKILRRLDCQVLFFQDFAFFLFFAADSARRRTDGLPPHDVQWRGVQIARAPSISALFAEMGGKAKMLRYAILQSTFGLEAPNFGMKLHKTVQVCKIRPYSVFGNGVDRSRNC